MQLCNRGLSMKKVFKYLKTLMFLLIMLMVTSFSFAAKKSRLLELNTDLLRKYDFDGINVLNKSQFQKDFVQIQNSNTQKLLTGIQLYSQVKARHDELNPTNPPLKVFISKKYFYLKSGSLIQSDGTQENILVSKDSLNGSVVVDFKFSPNEKKILFGVAKNESDSIYWSVFDLELQKVIPDQPTRVRIYEVTWDKDSEGFFYPAFSSLEQEFQKTINQSETENGVPVKFRKLGTKQDADQVMFDNPYQSTVFSIYSVEDSSTYVAHRIKSGFTHKIQAFYKNESGDEVSKWKPFSFPDNTLGRFIIATNNESIFLSSEGNNNFSIVAYSNSTGKKTRDVVRNSNQFLFAQAQSFNRKLFIQAFDKEFNNTIFVYNFDGSLFDKIDLNKLNFPGRGSLSVLHH